MMWSSGKDMGYQLDLFYRVDGHPVRPGACGDGGTEAGTFEERQALSALTGQRALTQHLMERVAAPANLNQAYRRVKANRGGPGVDGMTVDDLLPWIRENKDGLVKSLLDGTYRPQTVLGRELPKPGGGVRQLGIPTVVDRLVQQAILQVLQPLLDPTFSRSSFGFRPGRGAHDALAQARRYVSEGYEVVVDLDLEKFFDRVNHDLLMGRVARRIADKRLLRIIRRFLEAGLMRNGVDVRRSVGTPQGGPLSPLLANLLLDDLDKELEARRHRFCRYADDCNIYVRSRRAGERVMASVTEFLEVRLRLRVNREKSAVALVSERSFLGHRLLVGGGLGLSEKSRKGLKDRLRKITRRRRGISLSQMIHEVNEFAHGWVGYFQHAWCKGELRILDCWLRRRLRCFRIKQCKRGKGVIAFLKEQGITTAGGWTIQPHSSGWWRLSHCPPVEAGMSTRWFRDQGLVPMLDRYGAFERSGNRRGTRSVCPVV